MKKNVTVVCHHETGVPEEVVRVERWELPDLQAHQVLVEMQAAPIDPADLNVLEGKYPVRTPPPRVLGSEGVGVVVQCGSAVTHLRAGQHVIAPTRMGSWCEACVADADQWVAVPDEIPFEQAAMLAVNPPTAWRMLEEFVDLKPGDWVIQNAANSAVGRSVIQVAHHRGWRTVNIVRRPELIAELKAEGADVVVTDAEPWSKRVREWTGGAEVRLGLNAVGGDSAREVARSLAPHGTMVTYGAMSLQPLRIENGLLIFKDIRFRGVMITQWYQNATRAQIESLLAPIFALAQQGKLKVPIEKMYRLEEAKEAIRHASRSGRGGKVLFRMR